VLQGDVGVVDEPVVGPAAELPCKFCTLGETGRAQGVALADEAFES
jgi:hypothetical protein